MEFTLPYATIERDRLIKIYYPNHSTNVLAIALGISPFTVYRKAYALGIKKSPEYLKEKLRLEGVRLRKLGAAHRFPKGHTPANKGKKMSPKQYDRCKATMFKKGQKPHNTKFDGCISVRIDNRTNRAYLYIRITEGRWDEYHRYLWEQKFGEIPKGFKLAFKDNNTANISLENLELISDEEMMRRNTIHRFPEDLKKAIRALSKLKKQIYGEEHNG